MASKKTDAEWFREQINAIFGEGGQSSLARFLALCGDGREHKTILRTIQNWLSGRNKPSGEMRALMLALRKPDKVALLVERARGG